MVGRLWPEVMVMADVPCVSLHVARFSRAQKKGHCLLESFPCLSASVFFEAGNHFHSMTHCFSSLESQCFDIPFVM